MPNRAATRLKVGAVLARAPSSSLRMPRNFAARVRAALVASVGLAAEIMQATAGRWRCGARKRRRFRSTAASFLGRYWRCRSDQRLAVHLHRQERKILAQAPVIVSAVPVWDGHAPASPARLPASASHASNASSQAGVQDHFAARRRTTVNAARASASGRSERARVEQQFSSHRARRRAVAACTSSAWFRFRLGVDLGIVARQQQGVLVRHRRAGAVRALADRMPWNTASPSLAGHPRAVQCQAVSLAMVDARRVRRGGGLRQQHAVGRRSRAFALPAKSNVEFVARQAAASSRSSAGRRPRAPAWRRRSSVECGCAADSSCRRMRRRPRCRRGLRRTIALVWYAAPSAKVVRQRSIRLPAGDDERAGVGLVARAAARGEYMDRRARSWRRLRQPRTRRRSERRC